MREELFSGLLAVIVYLGTVNHQFVYDDRKAVLGNPSVVGRDPSLLLTTDFWGVPLSHNGSHKSFRPVTSITFRLDWLVNPSPAQFHLTNILFHGVATGLYVRFCKDWVTERCSLLAGILFAVHPIHTEAVAGVVGRAEIVSSVFFLACLIVHGRSGWTVRTVVLATLSMLAKEQGVTVLGVCGLLDLLSRRKPPAVKKSLIRVVLTVTILVSVRSLALRGTLPTFSKSDNPASHSESLLTRTLTFLYLPVLNLQLLLNPSVLSYDWSMDAVPLITSLLDVRNLASAGFYSLLLFLVQSSFVYIRPRLERVFKKGDFFDDDSTGPGHRSSKKVDTIQVMVLSLSLVILSFLPATNLFFYVGFVLAERVLYLPSLGYCLLLSNSLENLFKLRSRVVKTGTSFLILVFVLKTLLRNTDWQDEERLFSSGIHTNPAKSWSNYANILESQGDPVAAEMAFKEALLQRPNMADAHYNLGILMQRQQRLEAAVACYNAAIRFRPKLGLAYLNLGLSLVELGRKSEAVNILEKCAKVDDNGLKDPAENANARISSMFHLGKLFLESGRADRAIQILHRAVNASRSRGRSADQHATQLEKILNLMGEAYQYTGNTLEAEHWYFQSLQENPSHVPAHLTLAKMLSKNVSRSQDAENWFIKAKDLSPDNSAVYVHYGLFLLDGNRFREAANNFAVAVRLQPTAYDYVFNLAVAARLDGQLDLAEENYRRAVDLRPDESEPHLNLGALLHLRGRLLEAESEYLTAWRLNPGDQTTSTNLRRLHNIMKNHNLRIRNIDQAQSSGN